jgi:ubiquinone/menaquinone biosynthesis C-methylase UbiE
VGCGHGVGVEIILDRFGAARAEAFDLDPKQVRLAEGRLARFGADRVRVFVADVTSIPAPDSSFDAVFDFGAIHQVMGWRQAVAEVARVLKPGGRYFFEAITRPLFRQSMRIAMEPVTNVTRTGFDRTPSSKNSPVRFLPGHRARSAGTSTSPDEQITLCL